MKKIIRGKVYDTDTAQLVGSWDNGQLGTDLGYYGEDLYRKRTGEYFLDCYGGPMSPEAVHEGATTTGGESLVPVGYEEADKWAMEHLSADDYQAEFGEVSEDGEDEVLYLRISPAAKVALDREASKRGTSRKAVVESLLLEL